MRRKFLTWLFAFGYKHPLFVKTGQNFLFGGKINRWREAAAARIPQGKRTLEMGCGMFPAIDHGILLDVSLPLLRNIRPGKDQQVMCASVFVLPFPDGSIDSAVSVFPPGVAADEGFFGDQAFWEELYRVLAKDGVYVAAVYVEYRQRFWKFLARLIDPFPKEFWGETKALASGFILTEELYVDPFGNRLIIVEAKKQ